MQGPAAVVEFHLVEQLEANLRQRALDGPLAVRLIILEVRDGS